MFLPILQFHTLTERWQQNTRTCLVSAAGYGTSSSKNSHFKYESKLCGTKHDFNQLFPSRPSYTFLQIEELQQKMTERFNMYCCGFFSCKMKFRLILVHTESFQFCQNCIFRKEKSSYGRGKYPIISIPLCLRACQLIVLQSA